METQVSVHIPEISNEMLWELYSVIRPVVSFEWKNKQLVPSKEGLLFYIKTVNPISENFLWNPQPGEEATGLKMFCDITTYHSYTYNDCFNPTIAEVLSQIPDEYIGENGVAAFEIIKYPKKPVDFKKYAWKGYHVAKTRLYTKNIRSK
jgi:hypothetical protein